MAEAVTTAAPRCARCGADEAPLVVNDSKTSLCLRCVDELGGAAGVDRNALEVLRLLTAAKRQAAATKN